LKKLELTQCKRTMSTKIW